MSIERFLPRVVGELELLESEVEDGE